MGRDELVELLADVRHNATTHELLRESIPRIHHALSDIARKRSHFLEDACAVVLKQSFRGKPALDYSSRDDDFGDGAIDSAYTLDAIALCVAFAEPLVEQLPVRQADENVDATRQRAVLVAFLLHVLGDPEILHDDESQSTYDKLSTMLLRCGIDLLVIVWTLRFREELAMFRSMLLPHRERNESDCEDDGDGDENEDEIDSDREDADDEEWIVQQVASAMGFHGPLAYFIKESGQEYAFASWSSVGIVRLVAQCSLVGSMDPSPSSSSSTVVVSRYSNLFAVAAAAQALLQGPTTELKRQGLVVLKTALRKCDPGQLELRIDDESDKMSFQEASAAFRARDWISPLVELTSNAMVSFPEPSDRAMGLAIFRQLLQIVEPSHRFWLIQRLALRCPYSNIAAVLVDQLRNDTFRAWSASPSALGTTSPYLSAPLSSLIVDLLQLLTERDLKTHADLLASVASLIRFVTIRDKENRTGFRSPDTIATVRDLLLRLQSRLRSTLSQVQPTSASTTATASIHNLLHDENSRFILVEAALESTIALLPSVV